MKVMKIAATAALALGVMTACTSNDSAAPATVTVTASSSPSTPSSTASSTTSPSPSRTTTTAPVEDEVDCGPNSTLSQAEWVENCEGTDNSTLPPEGDIVDSPVDSISGNTESVPAVALGESYTYPDGLKVTVTNWRQGADSSVGEPYVVFDTTLENVGTAPIAVSYWEGAIYGDAGEQAMSVLADEWEANDRYLQPGAKDTITATLDVSSTKVPATVQFEFYDYDTLETPRPNFLLNVNGGIQ